MARRKGSGLDATIDCGSDDFAEVIYGFMDDHCFDVDEETTDAAVEAGQKAASLLRERSRKRKGNYAKGWKASAVASESGVEVVVHNAKAPQITHLLEKGHAIANQYGSYDGSVAGDGVIAQVADEVSGEFLGRLQS